MCDLLHVFPISEPVKVGGQPLMALPLRLVDLARLQGFLRDQSPCPLDVARGPIARSPEGSEARRRLLRDCFGSCQRWPARLGSEDGRKLLDSEAGLAFWLRTVLGSVEGNPTLSTPELGRLADNITVGEYERLVRVAYGVSPLDELARLITPDSYPDRPGEPTNWGKVIRRLVVETGWTFAACGEVRLTQLAAFESDGKAGLGNPGPPPGMTRWEFSKRQRRFFGPDRDEEQGQ